MGIEYVEYWEFNSHIFNSATIPRGPDPESKHG